MAAERGECLGAWLEALPRDRLLALLQLAGDENVGRRLEPRARSRAGRRGHGHRTGADVDTLGSLTTAGHASAAVTVARVTLERLRQVYEQIDDSSGAVGEVAAELEEALQKACAASGSDPVETAEWPAADTLGEWSYLPEIDLGGYWDLLGNAGRARFSELVAEAARYGESGWAARIAQTSSGSKGTWTRWSRHSPPTRPRTDRPI